MNTAVFITVRSDSRRLPYKCWMTIRGKSVLQHIVDRAKEVFCDNIVLCTTDRSVDDGVEELAHANKVLCYRGSTDDKLDRWRDACDRFEITHFVTFDADDLFCDPKLMSSGLSQLISNGVDLVKINHGMICGSYTYAFKADAVRRACEIKTTHRTEMVDKFFRECDGFVIQPIECIDARMYNSKLRLTLDYQDDYNFFSTVFAEMGIDENTIPLGEIVDFLMRRYDIIDINSYLMGEWKANQTRIEAMQ